MEHPVFLLIEKVCVVTLLTTYVSINMATHRDIRNTQ